MATNGKDQNCGCCHCFRSAAAGESMENSIVTFSHRANHANALAMDAATFVNTNFQAVATNTLNRTNESQLSGFIAALNAVTRTPTPA